MKPHIDNLARLSLVGRFQGELTSYRVCTIT